MKPEEIRDIALEVADELNKVKRAGQSFSARDNVIDDYAVRFVDRAYRPNNPCHSPGFHGCCPVGCPLRSRMRISSGSKATKFDEP